MLIVLSELLQFTQLLQVGVLYLDILCPGLPVDDSASKYSHDEEAYDDGYYQENEAYGFAR